MEKLRTIGLKRIIIFVLAVFGMIAFFSMFVNIAEFDVNHDETIFLSENWTIVENDEVVENASLKEYNFSAINIGDTIVLKNRIPESMNTHLVMTFTSYLSTVDVYVEKELIYSFGHELASTGAFVPSGKHIIEIPDNCGGKEFEIIITPNENDSFTKIEKLEIGKMAETFIVYMSDNMVNILACIFLIIFGIVISVLSVGSLLFQNRYVKLIPIGMFSFLIGLYGLCIKEFWVMCGFSLYSNTICEYITLFILPTALTSIFLTMIKGHTKIWKLVLSVTCIWIVFTVLAILLHFNDVVRFPKMLMTFHLLGIITVTFSGYVVIVENKKNRGENTLTVIGFLALCVGAIIDVGKYYFVKYITVDDKVYGYIIVVFGSLIFIVLLLINFMFDIYKFDNEQTEKRVLSKLAYIDELCQTYNRTKCNEVTQELDNSNEEYAVVLFDLNGLKMTNDTKGHAKGDVLIKEFASVLKECFDSIGEVYRIGGDEFVVIVQHSRTKIENALKNIDRIEQAHGELVGLDISASFGVAYSNELDKDNRSYTRVYSLADRRMYEMKSVYHEEKGINRR